VTRAAPTSLTLADVANVKARFPFRVGATSFVLHADLATNVKALAPLVDDIEVVVFESDEISPLPDERTLEGMRRAAEEHGVTYTIHLPLDVRLASPDGAERERAAAVCSRVIDRMRTVEPFGYVAHMMGGDGRSARESLAQLARLAGDSAPICVENLAAPTDSLTTLAADTGTSLCLDVGHAVVDGWEVDGCAAWLDRHLGPVRVVHVHGIEDGKDHRDASLLPGGMLAAVVDALARDSAAQRVLTLEVFSEAGFARSVAAIEEFAS